MQCCVPFCTSSAHDVSVGSQRNAGNKEISFHRFPSEMHLRAAWLRALGPRDAHLPDCAVVCSQHFLRDDIHQTENGFRQVVTGAVPSTVLVCMMCLETDCELILLSKYKLEESYEKLTGYRLFDQGNLKQTVCVQCAGSLTNFSTFRERSLRARLLMMELVAKYEFITIQHMQMTNGTMPQPDPCDSIKVEQSDEDAQTELDEAVHRVMATAAVKNEECSDSISGWSVDEDLTEDVKKMTEGSEQDDSGDTIALAARLVDDAIYKCLNRAPADDEPIAAQGPVKCESATVIANSKHTTQRLNYNPCPVAESSRSLFAATSVGVRGASKKSEEVIGIDIGEANKQSSDSNRLTDINIDRLTNCVVKLYDVVKHPRQAAPIRDGPLTNTREVTNLCDRRNVDALCDYKTGRKGLLLIHTRAHTGEKPYSCKLCDYKAGYKINLMRHMRTHTGEKPFSCTLCDYKSGQKAHLLIHTRTHTGEKPYSCELCDYKSVQKVSLMKHMRTHTGEKPYSCELCDYKSVQKVSLMKHMITHTGEKPYSCELCDYKAGNKGSLIVHLRTHTGEKPYSCELCDYKTGRKGLLLIHTRTHTGEKPYSCELCDYKSVQKVSLMKHMRTHTGEKPYSCELCDYKSVQKVSLIRHMRTHTGEKPYSCELCDYKAGNKGSLIVHLRTHTGEKPYSCELCDYKTGRKGHLLIHTRTHTGEKPYSCKLCDYKAGYKMNLMRHIRTHTSEKPFSCTLCDYKAGRKGTLMKHLRTHTGEKPFCCTLCDYKTGRKGDLLIHTRTHTGEKPYSCELCDHKAGHKGSLMVHLRTHTGEKPFS